MRSKLLSTSQTASVPSTTCESAATGVKQHNASIVGTDRFQMHLLNLPQVALIIGCSRPFCLMLSSPTMPEQDMYATLFLQRPEKVLDTRSYPKPQRWTPCSFMLGSLGAVQPDPRFHCIAVAVELGEVSLDTCGK